ncbi:MAG: hypothetical protein K2I92_01850 [Muribaculaceae bacterium]|nr:hypothetical protein [Muribaculaceae bacterium]
MNTEINLTSGQNSRHEQFLRRFLVMQNFVTILALASFYTQKGYEDFHVQAVFIISFLITAGYFLYKLMNTTCLLSDITPSYKAYGKTAIARLLSITCIALLAVRFFLPSEIVFIIQNILYIAAFVFLIAGIVFLIRRK